jgi:uncharacterized protein
MLREKQLEDLHSAGDSSSAMTNFVTNVVLLLLRGYKWAISPMLRPACRFVPTCSEYAMEAVERHGALNGGVKAIWRLLRCHPFAKGGFDPVVNHVGKPSGALENREFCSH